MATLISDELRWIADQIVNHCDYPSAVLSGLAPDKSHLSSGGFHCSLDDLKAHGNGGDYSDTRASDKGFNPQYGAAFDVSFCPADMIKAYGRVHAVWADRTDPRRTYVNAINGWDGTGDATRLDFDADTAKYASPDHRWHQHGEVHRLYVRDPKAARAVVSIYKGEPKAVWIATEEGDDMPTAKEIADEIFGRLDTAKIRNGRSVGGTLDGLAKQSAAHGTALAALLTYAKGEAAEVVPSAEQNATAVLDMLAAAGSTDQDVADALRAALGARAAAVGQLLSA